MNRSYWDISIFKFDILILLVFPFVLGSSGVHTVGMHINSTSGQRFDQRLGTTSTAALKMSHECKWAYRARFSSDLVRGELRQFLSIWSPTNLLGLVCRVFDYAVSAVCQGFGLGNGGASRGWTWRMLDGFTVSPNFKLQTHLAEADSWCPCFRYSISFAGARSNQLVLDKGRELRVYSGHHCFEVSSFGTEFVLFWLLNLTTCSGCFSCFVEFRCRQL